MSCRHFKKHILVDKSTIVVPEGDEFYFGHCKLLTQTPNFEFQLRFCNSDSAFNGCEHYQKEAAGLPELKNQTTQRDARPEKGPA